jgi:hypothetical protein
VFISQELGLPKTVRTLVHEIHHMLYPSLISMQEAEHADDLLQSDEERIKYLKGLCDQYVTGDMWVQLQVIQALNRPEFEVNGLSFMALLDNGISMQTFVGAVNEAYHYLQMESPTYSRIGTYSGPLDRVREFIPRMAELRYGEHVDHPEIIQFIAPGLTEIYQNIYLPHIDRRLAQLREKVPSRIEALLETMPEDALYDHIFVNPQFMRPWTEDIGEIKVTHPAGDTHSLAHEFTDVLQSADLSRVEDRLPEAPVVAGTAETAEEVFMAALQPVEATAPITSVPVAPPAPSVIPVEMKKSAPGNSIVALTIRNDGQLSPHSQQLASSLV